MTDNAYVVWINKKKTILKINLGIKHYKCTVWRKDIYFEITLSEGQMMTKVI